MCQLQLFRQGLSILKKCIRKSHFGCLIYQIFSPRPNHGGPRGVQSQGPDDFKKTILEIYWGTPTVRGA